MAGLPELDSIRALIESDPSRAAEQARRLVASAPGDAEAVRLLREAVRAAAAAASPSERHSPDSAPELIKARAKLEAGKEEAAELLVRERLRQAPRDFEAMNLLADIAARCGFLDNAILILRRAVGFSPVHAQSWAHLGRLLHRQNKFGEALEALGESLRLVPENEATLSYTASVLVQLRRLEEGIDLFERLVAAHPNRARGWMNYAFVLKTMGRAGEAIAAYRTSVALDPDSGPAWWGLANLKVARFLPEDLDAMGAALAAAEMTDTERCDLHFAFAKALDQFGDHDAAAGQLELGKVLRRTIHPYDPATVTEDVDGSIALFTRAFFAARAEWGSSRPDPIFILGMPRSGSTLVEQILASHSLVEGTEELFTLQQIAGDLAKAAGAPERFADYVAGLPRQAFERLGERYLSETQRYRTSERPFFTDKMPGNWPYVGLIHLILPNARIVDVRRDPRDCCFANYAQHFQWGMNAMYGQEDLASYYRDYVRLMRHFDSALPGRIHRIIYEEMVDSFEPHVRALLDHLGLPFEASCLRFFETDRAVHTPSAQQVRRPINRDGIGRWIPYESHLGPLIEALGDLPSTYRQ
jgi:tetratricopeptide (TPR) repeat protein